MSSQAGKIPLPGQWALRAACRGKPTAWWYPSRWDAVERATAMWAKGICAGCPVAGPCLEHALRYREVGIWAGTTEAERKLLRRKGAA